ncbi:serine racemase VanT catalytic subunit [Cohnella lupini]|uniref:Alanine racemase n=1 Tax=Cohnella lupini TaxID=1294267 RepID=A0A3D9IQ70_9BACL|nr:serine racemase VanT catalytic subunit [Cohnella lupini]RED63226.1 serine/alanine racemase [Cohnella lupini]
MAKSTLFGLYALNAAIASIGIKTSRKTDKHRAWAEINLDNLDHNLSELRRVLPSATSIMAVVKADAYGHGAVRVAKRLYAGGVRFFAVAEIEEAAALRKKGVKGDILILGYTPSDRLEDLIRFNLTQTVTNAEDAERLQAFGKKLKVHIKIDTGMNRLGEPWSHEERILSMYRHSHLIVLGTYSHLAVADSLEPDDVSFTRTQTKRFNDLVERIRDAGLPTGRLHLQSSYGILNHSGLTADLARPGIALYGLLSNDRDRVLADVELRPVLSLKASVTRVAMVRAGESVGYGRSFVASRDTKIASVSIGYADGVPRVLSENGGCVLIRGRRAKIIGKISMDQITVDITSLTDVEPGDTVTLIGQDGDNSISAGEIGRLAGTITNDVLCSIGSRVSRETISLH